MCVEGGRSKRGGGLWYKTRLEIRERGGQKEREGIRQQRRRAEVHFEVWQREPADNNPLSHTQLIPTTAALRVANFSQIPSRRKCAIFGSCYGTQVCVFVAVSAPSRPAGLSLLSEFYSLVKLCFYIPLFYRHL